MVVWLYCIFVLVYCENKGEGWYVEGDVDFYILYMVCWMYVVCEIVFGLM